MNIDFVKASLSKNMTVLVTNYIARDHYSRVAHTLMDYEYVNAEQVGFLEAPKHEESLIRLAMSGGELCGNAVLSAATYCHYKGLTDKQYFYLDTTGVEEPLECWIERKSSHLFEAKAAMPFPSSTEAMTVHLDGKEIAGKVIHMDGISHFLTEYWVEQDEFLPVMNELTERIDNQAIGIIPYRKLENNDHESQPFVHVKETGSSFFEQACGSGSLALGGYLAKEKDNDKFHIHQPGGVIEVGAGDKHYISTTVRFTCEGVCEIDLA